MISLCKEVIADYPRAILYPNFLLQATTLQEKVAHFKPLADAGFFGLAPVDPGMVSICELNENGLPVGNQKVRFTFDETNEEVKIANECQAPLIIGVYEPVHLRWVLVYHKAGKLPAGSMIKLYFGGEYSIFKIGKPGLKFGLPPNKESLDAYLKMLEGTNIPWNVGIMGDFILDTPLARYALERGGHLRVGIEDVGGRSELTNRETVIEAVKLANQVGRPVAQGKEVLDILYDGCPISRMGLGFAV